MLVGAIDHGVCVVDACLTGGLTDVTIFVQTNVALGAAEFLLQDVIVSDCFVRDS